MKKLRAFIVEDNPVILVNLSETLEELAGVEVVGSAIDEAGALQWMDARTGACDILIIDLFLKTGSVGAGRKLTSNRW